MDWKEIVLLDDPQDAVEARLKELQAEIDAEHAEIRATGAREEREAVVRWLREQVSDSIWAQAIEAGEHRKEGA